MEEKDQKPQNMEGEEKFLTQTDILGILKDVSYILAGIMLAFLLLFRTAFVDGSSMFPTLHDGDQVLMLSSVIYPRYKAGDVVVIHEKEFQSDYNLVKRVIATEGQTVDIDFEAGVVYLDGVAQEESYVNTPTNLEEGMDFPLTVPENCVFVMGDNRNNSKDSRDPSVGFVDQREMFGKVVLITFPGADPETEKRDFSRIGAVK